MTFRKLAAVALIFIGASAAWTILGSSVLARTGQFDGRLEQEVHLLWGGPHRQTAPDAWIERPGTDTEIEETKAADGQVTKRQVTKPVVRRVPVGMDSTRATADLDLEHRRKGLLWYATYNVAFKGTYTFRNPDSVERSDGRAAAASGARTRCSTTSCSRVNGQPAALAGDVSKEMVATVTAAPNAVVTLDVGYRSRGLGTWTYAFAAANNTGGTARVRDFQLTVDTNVVDIDFPAGSMSPNQRTRTADGWRVQWTFNNLLSGQTIGVTLPEKLNPGPFAARVTFFAPVGLLFFLAVMVILGATSGPSLHPMHYWFVAAAFFAFHLLLAYLVDHISVHAAFGVSAAVSLALVVSYLRLVTGDAARAATGRRGAGRVPGALQLRVLLRGLHRAGDHHRRGDHLVRADADDGARVLGRRVRGRRRGRPASGGGSPWQPLASLRVGRRGAGGPAQDPDRAHGAPDAVHGRDAADRRQPCSRPASTPGS